MKFSFVVPIYNDGSLAQAFADEFELVFKNWTGITEIEEEVELIFVNDGSKNDSMDYLIEVAGKHPFVKVIELSRNFGQHIALSCGYKYAKGDYVGMLNVDMEDPPSEIPKMIEHMNKNGIDIVLGIRPYRQGSYMNKLTSMIFNFVLNKLTGHNVPLNVATLRVMNRKFVDAYNSLTEKSRYLPGLENWLGFHHGYLAIRHELRKTGKSSYSFGRRLKMAIESILSFSDLPLKLITYFGFFVFAIGFILTVVIVILKLLYIDFQAGYVSTLAVIIFLSGVQIIVTGMASLYIGRILKEVQNRPLYVIRNTYNI